MARKKRVEVSNTTIKSESINKTGSKDMIFYVLYLLIVLLPQYFRGGYFQETYLIFCFSIGFIMLYHIYTGHKTGKSPIIKSGEDLSFLILIIVYALSFFYGINKRGSIVEFVRYISFISVFLISRDLHRDRKRRTMTLDILIFSGVLISIISVGTMIGSWEYSGSYVGGRLFGVFQYPNTLASYVAFMYFLTMGQALIEEKPFKMGIYGLALNIFFSTLIFTYSRGMWLIFPVVLLLYFILLSGRKKVQLFFYTLGSLLVSLPFSFIFLGMIGKEALLLWGIFIGSTILSGIVLYILGKSTGILKKVSLKVLITTIVILGIIATIVLGVLINSAISGDSNFIPKSIVNRLTGISSSDNSLQARIIFSMDALKLAKRNPIFGSGGSSWITAYRSVQSYPYSSNHVHNHFLQILVEVGALGLLLYLGILLTLGYKYLVLKRSDIENSKKTMADSLMIVCFTILAHAFIDFDFDLTGYYIIFWILLGIISSMVSRDKVEVQIFTLKLDNKSLKKISIMIPILSLVGVILSGMLYAGYHYHEKGLDAEYADDFDLAEECMKKASSLDPYNTEYREDLVGVYLKQYYEKSDNSYGNLAKEEVDKTLKIGKRDPQVYIKATESYFKFGMVDEGIGLINRAMELQPLVMGTYLQNTNVYTSTFDHYISEGEIEKAEELAKEGYDKVYASLIAANKKTVRPLAKDNKVFLELSQLKYYSENMEEFLSYYDRGLRLKYAYGFDLDVDGDEKLELVSIWNSEGGQLGYDIRPEEGGIRLKNPGKEYGVFDSVGLDLNPNTTYIVSFDAKGDMDMDKVSFHILDTKAEKQIQTDTINLDLNREYNTYQYGFSTDGDIGQNSSKFRFVIGGDNGGYMDLREIRIFEAMN